MRYCLLFVLLAASAAAQAQQWAAHLGVNMYYPAGTDLKGYHPVLWYTDAGSPKIRTGGFGASVTHQRPMGARMRMEYRLALQRHRYYDLATAFTDDNGSLLGGVAGVNTHWSAGVSAVPMLDFGAQRRWSVGLGLGLRANAFSVSNYGSAYVNG